MDELEKTNICCFFSIMEAEGEGWYSVKLAKAPPRVIYYRPLKVVIFIVVLFVKCYIAFH